MPPPIAAVRTGQRALIVGQAPGRTEPERGQPFAHTAGRTLRSWFAPIDLDDEHRFRATFALTAVVKCFPGRAPGARGDRRPTAGMISRCRHWTDAQIALLDPPLLIPVGQLAIEQFLGKAPLAELIGRRFALDDRAVVPLPHPSGASAWLNRTAHRALVRDAVALIGAELARV